MTNERLPWALDLETLARRLDDLERQNRRLRFGLVGGAVLLAVAGAAAQATAVTGERFVLVDAQSRTRATLEVASPDTAAGRFPVLTFMDATGRPRLRLGLGSRGALLEAVDQNGKVRDYLGPVSARPLTHE